MPQWAYKFVPVCSNLLKSFKLQYFLTIFVQLINPPTTANVWTTLTHSLCNKSALFISALKKTSDLYRYLLGLFAISYLKPLHVLPLDLTSE